MRGFHNLPDNKGKYAVLRKTQMSLESFLKVVTQHVVAVTACPCCIHVTDGLGGYSVIFFFVLKEGIVNKSGCDMWSSPTFFPLLPSHSFIFSCYFIVM